jgi:hypothetical protein
MSAAKALTTLKAVPHAKDNETCQMCLNVARVIDRETHTAELVEALRGIADADPDAPEVESWKWLARKFMNEARAALALGAA